MKTEGIPREEAAAVVVGAGPAGLGAALGLARRGVKPLVVLERWPEAGGVPARYPSRPPAPPTYVLYTRGRVVRGPEFVGPILEKAQAAGAEIRLETAVLEVNLEERSLLVVHPEKGRYRLEAEALVFATGAREETAGERGWIAGARTGRLFHTMQFLEFLRRGGRPGWKRPVLAGSDLVSFSAAAELGVSGAEEVRMVDLPPRPRASLAARLYFRRWVKPGWTGAKGATVRDAGGGEMVLDLEGGPPVRGDALFLSGVLVPNSELLAGAGAPVDPGSRLLLDARGTALSSKGCFAAGNLLGGNHGGQWCFFSGLGAAKAAARFLRSGN